MFNPFRLRAGELVIGRSEGLNCARIAKYNASLEGCTVPTGIINMTNRTESCFKIIESIEDIGEDKDGIWFHLRWDDLEHGHQ